VLLRTELIATSGDTKGALDTLHDGRQRGRPGLVGDLGWVVRAYRSQHVRRSVDTPAIDHVEAVDCLARSGGSVGGYVETHDVMPFDN
jgi:hypothetical protein